MFKRFALPLWIVCLVGVTTLSGCRSTYYAAMEKVGVHKRDLLKRRVVAARDDQKKASEQFKDALTQLKELTGFQGGDLEETYDRLKSDFDRSESQAETVRQGIRDVETVAGDLFREWENEIKQISSPNLRASSRAQLRLTRERYADMHTALKRAEASMDPVLTKLRDQVLFLKHNLNAQAVGSLRGESASIQRDVERLLKEMNASIALADEFIQTLP